MTPVETSTGEIRPEFRPRVPGPENDLATKLPILLVLGAIAGGSIVFSHVDPTTAGFLPPCPFHFMTGLHCPGCGSTRALHHLLHGRLAEAFGLNALLILSLPFLAWSLASRTTEALWGRPFPTLFLKPWAIRGLLGLIVVYAVLRNLPFEPFSYLAP